MDAVCCALVMGWVTSIRVEGVMSLGLRVSESSLWYKYDSVVRLCFSLIPSSSELIQDLHPPPTPLSTFLPTTSMSAPANTFSFKVSIPFMVVFEMTNCWGYF